MGTVGIKTTIKYAKLRVKRHFEKKCLISKVFSHLLHPENLWLMSLSQTKKKTKWRPQLEGYLSINSKNVLFRYSSLESHRHAYLIFKVWLNVD